ncbi:hypothetical protein [Actinomadura sp. 9N407]|uniref:hypothetical protein n=1 Tax=Actinomadura sp. 9N407 TaxID=3375154 RepID=UPI0037AF0E3C
MSNRPMPNRPMPNRPMPPRPMPGNNPRSHRRHKKRGAGKLGIAGALGGAVAMAAVAAGIVIFRPPAGDETTPPSSLSSQEGGQGSLPSTPAPAAGPVLSITTPEGYGYGLAAVKAGTDGRPPGGQAAPAGTTYVYAEYILTNNQRRPALLDYPADLFMPLAQVPDSSRERCMPQPGIPEDMCTLPNTSKVTARVGGAKPPISEAGDTLIPAGASYLVRITSDFPVKDAIKPSDLKLFVWNARYTSDRKGIELAFP